MKVLIVDDEHLIINLLKLLLEKEGIEVESAINEEEAKKKFDKTFDLLIIDKNLGNTSGLKLADKFKCKNNFLRIILMSGDHSIQRNIAKICHELNQPAMSILGISQLLSDKYNDKIIHTLKEQAERLSKILNKLSYTLHDN